MQIRLATRLVRSNRFSDCTLADAAGIAKVHVDTWRATYAGLVPDAHLANLHYERSTEFWQRNFR